MKSLVRIHCVRIVYDRSDFSFQFRDSITPSSLICLIVIRVLLNLWILQNSLWDAIYICVYIEREKIIETARSIGKKTKVNLKLEKCQIDTMAKATLSGDPPRQKRGYRFSIVACTIIGFHRNLILKLVFYWANVNIAIEIIGAKYFTSAKLRE